jgi:biopolymer transport protein ExbB
MTNDQVSNMNQFRRLLSALAIAALFSALIVAPFAYAQDAAKKAGDAPDTKSAAPATEESPTEESSVEPPAEEDTLGGKLSAIAHSGALGYMLQGGLFMWPILLLGILAAGVVIERFRSLKMLGTNSEKLRGDVRQLLDTDRAEEALALCDREQGPVPAILSAGLRKYVVLRRLNYDPAKVEEQVLKGMDDYTVHIVAALERHLPILATVSSVAPMLGFLGTVQGMVVSFADIEQGVLSGGGQNIILLAAAGIKVSLLTTVLGLVVGIPAFMAYNYFTSVINRFVLDVEESAAELIETVTLQQSLEGRPS